MLFLGILTCAMFMNPGIVIADKCIPPAQQGFPYTSNCTVENTKIGQDGGIYWLLRPVGFMTPVFLWLCFEETSLCTLKSKVSWINTGANISQYDNETHRSYFTIYNVTTFFNGYTIQWQASTYLVQACELEVFDFNSIPSCDQPYFENKGSDNSLNIHVIVNCDISNVYPVPRCESQDAGNVQIKEHDATPSTETSGYYDRQCTLSVPVTDFVAKEYGFQVLMYPDVTNGMDYGKNASSPHIDLSLPKPVCEDPRLTASNNDVIVTCNITSVFTGFNCQFKKQTDAHGDFEPVDSQTHSTLLSCSNSPPVSCNNQCTLTVSVSLLGGGRHRFTVSMSKDAYTTDSDSTNAIHLEYPVTRIVNCPNGTGDYIQEDTTGTCECELLHRGNPPGRVQWLLPDNTEVGHVMDDTRSILSLTYDPENQNPQLYFCQGTTPISGRNPNKTFSPKFAYGPAIITEFNVPSLYNMCPPFDPINITCSIDNTTVNPEPEVVITVEGRNDLQTVESHTSGMYRYQLSFTPQSEQEQLNVTCLTTNSKNADRSVTSHKDITVQAPPTDSPNVSIDNQPPITDGQVVNVTTSQSAQVHCYVQGGYPPVTNVTIKCGSHEIITAGTQTSLSITVNMTYSNELCVCTAEHATGCYQNNSTHFTLNVHLVPDEPQMRILGGKTLEASSIVVCVENDKIDLVCKVDSGYSLTLSCEFPLSDSDEDNEHTVPRNDVVITKRVSPDMHGKKCTCFGNHPTGPVQSSPLTFLVVSRPSDVTCSINLLSYGLKVSCEIGKVFPEASCQWFYHNENDQHSKSVSNSQINDYDHQEHTHVDGTVHYKSTCSATLTRDSTSFRTGLLTVKVKINPDLSRIYSSMTNDTSINTQEIGSICKYINCFFLATLDFPLTDSVIQQLLAPLNNDVL